MQVLREIISILSNLTFIASWLGSKGGYLAEMILLSSLVQATLTNDLTGIWHENQLPVGCRWLPTNKTHYHFGLCVFSL